ncbi:interferon regulatory factor 7 isoform X2 [Microcaecilia unicolor]|uniref:Interferon regulatory factor 7 isoform X2 n=1 Tax=Microcaecilia unicolor TaxID=1415580 RepID=A0A6P7Y287_9AMPH|nr:interferon regulatory factor 7 isoform X2 [Microcaecilia unicolor]
MAGNDRGYPRPRFLPWLIQQIDSNKYEGLYWVDEEHTMFRIKWKHLSRRDSRPKDYELFKAWSIEGGKYNDQCEDRTIWKTNFRCALNSVTMNKERVFTEVVNKSSDLHDPHKVYRINCPQDSAAASSHFFENHNGLNSEEDDDESLRISPDLTQIVNFKSAMPQPVCQMNQGPLEEKMQGMSLENHLPECIFPTECITAEEGAVDNGHYHSMDFLETEVLQPIYSACVQACGQEPVPAMQSSCLPWQATLNPNIPAYFSEEAPVYGNELQQSRYPPEGLQGNTTANSPVENSYPGGSHQAENRLTENGFIHPSEGSSHQNVIFPGNTFLTLEVTVLYRGRTMTQQQVNSPCLLSYNAVFDPSISHNSAVSFPSPDNLPDQKQVQYTTKLLQNVERGLLLEVDQEARRIYATRMGKCKVFWVFSQQLENSAQKLESNMLQRGEKTEIFSFDQFWMELRDYKAGRRRSPDYTLYLCFGQCFSEEGERIERKLILVKIVPQFCAHLHDLMQREGASSLNSENVSLQISNGSNNSLYELIDSCELMDIDISQLGSLFHF